MAFCQLHSRRLCFRLLLWGRLNIQPLNIELLYSISLNFKRVNFQGWDRRKHERFCFFFRDDRSQGMFMLCLDHLSDIDFHPDPFIKKIGDQVIDHLLAYRRPLLMLSATSLTAFLNRSLISSRF